MDLYDLDQAAGSPYSNQQMINFGYVIINKTDKFVNGIRKWNRLDPRHKTWDDFQTHFTTAHQELRESGTLQASEIPFQAANTATLVEGIVTGVQRGLTPTDAEERKTELFIEQANMLSSAETRTNQMMEQMMTMMSMMQQILANNQQQQNQTTSSTSSIQQAPGNRRKNRSKYCWSHGACAHDSASCRDKKTRSSG